MTRRYRGFAGHFIAAAYCRFHLCCEIGDYLVSTVGAMVREGPEHTGGPDVWADVGCGRKFETFVFRLGADICECGCGDREIAEWSEIDSLAANDVRAATENHEAMCQKYERVVAVATVPA